MYVNTSQRVPPFTFFGTMRLFLKEIFFSKIHVFFQKIFFLRFLSLRYGADFGRSRLVFFFSLQSHSEWSTFYNLFIFHICSSSKPESGGSILALNHNIFMLPKVHQVRPKGPPFGFFRHYATFFRKFSDSIKG